MNGRARLAIRCAALLLASVLAACAEITNPIVAQTGPTVDPALIGHWSTKTEDERVDLWIRREGQEGRVLARHEKAGLAPETAEWSLITARLERRDFASVRSIGEADQTWSLFAYQVSGDHLLIMADNNAFWHDAIQNGIVSGTLEQQQHYTKVIVTASESELRAVVQGHAALIFPDEPGIDLTRVPAGR